MVQFNRALSSFLEPDGFEQDSMMQQDCTPWVPATHPDGGLYFYDEERVCVSDHGSLQAGLIHYRRDCLLTPTCTTQQ